MFRQALAVIRSSSAEVTECEVFAEALASGLTFYDAVYVAHARNLGGRILTRDRAILKLGDTVACPIDG